MLVRFEPLNVSKRGRAGTLGVPKWEKPRVRPPPENEFATADCPGGQLPETQLSCHSVDEPDVDICVSCQFSPQSAESVGENPFDVPSSEDSSSPIHSVNVEGRGRPGRILMPSSWAATTHVPFPRGAVKLVGWLRICRAFRQARQIALTPKVRSPV